MKRSIAAVFAATAAGLAACDGGDAQPGPDATMAPDAVAAGAPGATVGSLPTELDPESGVPDFAAIFPGGVVESPPVTADGADGPGGLLTYTTTAAPDEIIAFYRTRAEAAGLASVMSMNQGEARAYGAALESRGASLQVVASPTEDGGSSVQLSWSRGG